MRLAAFGAGYTAGVLTCVGIVTAWLVWALVMFGERCTLRAGAWGSDRWTSCVASHAAPRYYSD